MGLGMGSRWVFISPLLVPYPFFEIGGKPISISKFNRNEKNSSKWVWFGRIPISICFVVMPRGKPWCLLKAMGKSEWDVCQRAGKWWGPCVQTLNHKKWTTIACVRGYSVSKCLCPIISKITQFKKMESNNINYNCLCIYTMSLIFCYSMHNCIEVKLGTLNKIDLKRCPTSPLWILFNFFIRYSLLCTKSYKKN